jgi:NIPSNAP
LPGSPRIFNLRVYESHNERAHLKKVEMFRMGELEIFKRVGLNPCFFGHAVAGGRMPNLTYLLEFADEESRAKAWARFREDAEWKRLKAKEGFADRDIVSKITNRVLVPTPYSQM